MSGLDDELKFWKGWIEGPYPWLGSWETCHKAWVSTSIPEISSRRVEVTEFHAESLDWLESWSRKVVGKTCVDIGCGCDGTVPFWRSASRRILLDPLVEEYQKLILETSEKKGHPGFSWFDGCEMMAKKATEVDLQADVIVFRNALDHDPEPIALLDAVLRMGKPGSRLYFWSELSHAHHRDDGHHDVPLSSSQTKEMIERLGWNVVRTFEAVGGPGYVCGDQLGVVADRERR